MMNLAKCRVIPLLLLLLLGCSRGEPRSAPPQGPASGEGAARAAQQQAGPGAATGARAVEGVQDLGGADAAGAPSEGELRQQIALALSAWDIPRALQGYAELRRLLDGDDAALLRDICWRYLSAAVLHGETWPLAERREAVGALGLTAHPEAVQLLARLAEEPAWELRWTALEALAAARKSPEAFEALARGASDEDRRVRCAAGGLLLEGKDQRGFKPALECGEPLELRYRALRLLIEQADDAPAEVLQQVIRHQAQEPRLALAVVLALRARPAERTLLQELEKDPKPMVKRAARCAMAVLDHGAARPARALAPFRKMLRGSEEQRSTAIFLLGLMGRRIGPLAAKLLAEQLDPLQPQLAGQVCVALAHLGTAEAAEEVASVLQRSYPLEVRRKAIMALGRLRGPAAARLLRDLLRDPQEAFPVKEVALAALSSLGDVEAVPDIARTALGREPLLVTSATAALAALPSPTSRATLRELLASPLAATRSHAALGLAAQADQASLPLLVRLLHDAERSVQYNAAAAIVRLVGAGE